MIISLIFVALSIATAIGAWVYINKTENSSVMDYNQKENTKHEKPINVLNIAKSKLSIDDISKSVITLEDNRKRCILLKIKNSDFNMLSQEGQSVTEDVLRQLALAIQYDIVFYSTTRTIDTSNSLNITNKLIETTSNLAIQQYALNYIRAFDSIITTKRISERVDYIILTYFGDMNLSIAELERRAGQFISTLKKINTKCEIVQTDQIVDLIYHDLNRNDYFNPSSAIKLGALDLYVGHKKREREVNV